MAANFLSVNGSRLAVPGGSLGATVPVTDPPSNTVAPAISGLLAVGQTITISNGTWTNSPTGYTVNLYAAATSGGTYSLLSTGSSYTLQAGDETKYLKPGVVATNGVGSSSEVLGSEVGPVAASGPTTQPRLQSTDQSYLGYFMMPTTDGVENSNQSWLRGSQLCIANDGLHLYGNSSTLASPIGIAKATIPALSGTATADTTFTGLTGWVATGPNGLDPASGGDSGYTRIGGLLHYNGRIIVSEYNYYGGPSAYSHKWMADDLASQQTGWQRVTDGTLPADFYAGSMCLVPSEWVSTIGAPAITGLGGVAVINRTSYGFSAHGFDPDDIGVVVGDVPATPLIWFDVDMTAATGSLAYADITGTTNDVWNPADNIAAVGIPTGYRTILFAYQHGYGPYKYGPGTSDPALDGTPYNETFDWCYDPDREGTEGTHAYPYRTQIAAYDINEVLAAADKRSVQPYATWTLPDILDGTHDPVPVGGTFDPNTNRLYYAVNAGSGWNKVHVYQLGTAP